MALARLRHASSLALLGVALVVGPGSARGGEAEDWFNRPFGPSTDTVNEGNLVFLARLPDRTVHRQRNHIVIGDRSLVDGWIDLTQCHDRLDAVPRSQVVFNRERSRALRITRAEGIGQAWVEGNTVQLADTRPGAQLCVRVETQALEPDGENGFALRAGPYMRRFLDGYYPMHVATRVTLGTTQLRYASASPGVQPGFAVWQTDNDIHFDALFEGRLVTRLLFRRVN